MCQNGSIGCSQLVVKRQYNIEGMTMQIFKSPSLKIDYFKLQRFFFKSE